MYKLWKKLPGGPRRALGNFWYDLTSRFVGGGAFLFVNHGYAPLEGDPKVVELPDELEPFQYQVQLYHCLAEMIPWEGKDVVEVSSGQGAGTAYLYDRFKPRSVIGVDIAPASVKHSNKAYGGRERLSFIVGDAQDLPIEDESCDIVINIESALNYPEPKVFLEEVDRILRPGGHLLITDYRGAGGMRTMMKLLRGMNYNIHCLEDISANIALALELADPMKQKVLRERSPAIFRGLGASFTFTGAAAVEEIERFRTGKKKCVRGVLQKPLRN